MAVRFILGRSGTGKTSHCIGRIVEALLDEKNDPPLILLVPEQATYQAERLILADERIAGYDRLHVLSFDRLAYLLLGKNTPKSPLSRIGRQMIVQRLLRVQSDKLKVFNAAAGRVGTAKAIANTISELNRYGRTADDIDELIEILNKYESDSLTALKFADIGFLFKEYLKFIEHKFTDPDVQLSLSRQAVSDSHVIKGASIWIDGFAGFTAAELSILSEVLRTVSDAQIALCMDPKSLDTLKDDPANLDPTSLFGPTEETYCRLINIIKDSKIKIDKPFLLTETKRFSNSEPLAHIESYLYEFEPEKIKTGENVKIAAAANGRAEVRFVAREILRLVKEKGCRFRDIAIIASDIDYYEHYLRAHLEDYEIPYFIDKRKPLAQHPMITLVLSALEIVTSGFSRAEVFNYLKTQLTSLTNYEIDLLENYCVAFGLRDEDWRDSKRWDFAGDDDKLFDNAAADKLRRQVAEPLNKLRSIFCPDDNLEEVSAEQFAKAVFDFLDVLGVRRRLNDWVQQALEEQDAERVDFHRQFSETFAEVFDEMAEAFAGVTMTCDEWKEILESAAGQMTLAFIPPRLDQVLVGSIERSRHPDLKAVFLIGCTQKQFPSPVGFDCVLTESDRLTAGSADFALGSSARDELARRQYLAYIAFTRPSLYLYATYPLVDKKAAPTVCSRLVTQLQSLFEDLSIEHIDSQDIDIFSINTTLELSQVICSGAGSDAEDGDNKNKLRILANELENDEKLNPVGQAARYALSYDNSAELEETIAAELYKDSLRCSATRLSAFAACPYRHFAKYVLGLKERKEFKFEPLDKGLFYHKVLDSLIKELNTRRLDFAAITDDELLSVLRNRIDKLLADDTFTKNFYAHSKHNAYIIDTAAQFLEDFVLASARITRAGDFRAKLSEAGFGDSKSDLGLYKLKCPDGHELLLVGKIDRIDLAQIGSQKTAIIFDYKLSGRSFSWAKYYHGLDIQLGIYMLAVRNSGTIPVGAFYVPIETRPAKKEFNEVDKQKSKFKYKADGPFNGQYVEQLDKTSQTGWNSFYKFRVTANKGQYGDYNKAKILKPQDFESFLSFTQKKICDLAASMAQGRIGVSPYRLNTETPCKWCEFRCLCRFDWQINEYRILGSVGKSQLLSEAQGDND